MYLIIKLISERSSRAPCVIERGQVLNGDPEDRANTSFIKPKPSGFQGTMVNKRVNPSASADLHRQDSMESFQPPLQKKTAEEKKVFIISLALVVMLKSASLFAGWSVGAFDIVRHTFNPDGSYEARDFQDFYLYEGNENTREADRCFAEGHGTTLVLTHPSMKAGGDGSWYACIKTPAGTSNEVLLG